ncbi:hypothetical protein DPMN_027348 [Dreissena polymorpha]|uniref:Uncharacterized protein n=1 Tax=Dreissena polymorpha TaxID=45954 RepID=A0A9D4RDD5_DREPO|nr:hypothetical protein DPMN_027348 [Dreissena polymorpha]
MGSDHLQQQVTLLNYIAQGTDAQCSGEQTFLLEKANWAQFRDLCSVLSLAFVHSQDSNEFCNTLSNKILSIAECSILVSSGKVKRLEKGSRGRMRRAPRRYRTIKKHKKFFKRTPLSIIFLIIGPLKIRQSGSFWTQNLKIGKNSVIQQL